MIRGEDLRLLRAWIGKYFKVYDVRWDIDSAAFFCDLQEETLEKKFDFLRLELMRKNYIPMLIYEGGEHIIYVTEKGPAKYKSVKVNVAMLLATICTTVFVGAMNWMSYDNSMDGEAFWQVFTPAALGNGALFFAFPLMLILGIHETGHYLMARRHGVAASLPFFIPVPLPPLGTFGAFISMREPIPSKKALLDIGVAGPIAGFCVAVPVIIVGFLLTDIYAMELPSDSGGLVYLGTSLFYDGLAYLFPTGDYLTHPTAMAGWVGLLVTFLNLLPAGQLDGGHVSRAMFGDKTKYLSYASIIIMFILSFYYQYYGWLLFIFIILFIGIKHPPPLNDITELDNKRWAAGTMVFIILIGCFTPVPLYPAELDHDGALLVEDDFINVAPNSTGNYTVTVRNTGNVEQAYKLKAELGPGFAGEGWRISLAEDEDRKKRRPTIPAGKERNFTLYISSPQNVEVGDGAFANLSLKWEGPSGETGKDTEDVLVMVGLMEIEAVADHLETVPGTSDKRNLTVRYLGQGNRKMRLEYGAPAGWEVAFGQEVFEITDLSTKEATTWFRVIVPPDEPLSTQNITISLVAENRTNETLPPGLGADDQTVTVKVLQRFDLSLDIERDDVTVAYGDNATLNVSVTNTGNGMDSMEVTVTSVSNLSVEPGRVLLELGPGETGSFTLVVEPLVDVRSDMSLLITAVSEGRPVVRGDHMVEVHVTD